MQKVKIQVRIARKSWAPGGILGEIHRKIWAEQSGNFNPIFCTYHYKKCLVRSLVGDLSDPLRRDESYLDALYIEL